MFSYHSGPEFRAPQPCANSVSRGASFLAERFDHQSGCWHDFTTNRSGSSSTWVTAYVLSRASALLAPALIESAQSALVQHGGTRGWGFSPGIPPDCDSTAFVLEALQHTKRSVLELAIQVVLAHQLPVGGFTTYADGEILKSFRSYGPSTSYAGWTAPHECVTSEVAYMLYTLARPEHALALERAVTWLISKADPAGFWSSYWWQSKYYTAPRVLPLLLRHQHLSGAAQAYQSAVAWILRTQAPSGWWSNGVDIETPCLLSTCWATDALLTAEELPSSSRAIDWIVSQQDVDGGWTAEPCLRIPPPDAVDPSTYQYARASRGVGSISTDNFRIYGTTTALATVSKATVRSIEP